MLSSDKNVETIAGLIELLKHYLGLQKEYVKLDSIDKVVRLLTAAALAIVLFLILMAVLLFFWIGVAFWLSGFMGMVWACLLVSALHVLVLTVFIIFRKSWIEKPLVRFLANLLMS
ncbi:MAG: phage holin family protein [Prevotella sp.]|nr:phage holin family protein [Prevotella sp.]